MVENMESVGYGEENGWPVTTIWDFTDVYGDRDARLEPL
jgi:hypothetical protein